MKKVKRLFLISVLLYLLIFIVSCDARPYFNRSSGYFKYKIDVDTKEVVLVGLTKKGEEQETLVIPSIIDGKKVSRIGYYKRRLWAGSYWASDFKSDKLKTIYFPSGFSKSYINDFYKDIPNIERIFWGDVSIDFDLGYKDTVSVYISKINYYEHLKQHEDYFDCSIKVIISNVTYYINDGTDNPYFVDEVSDSVVNVIPPTPYREGYKFTNWYKEKECINLWDFEKDKVPKIKYDADGNEIYEEIKIYAGWEEK